MTYRIKNWSSYQHIKSRNAPWIKVYRELLDDLEWHNLPSETAKILINCWLIGSENFGNLPDLPNLAFRLRISEVDVKNQLSLLTKWIADEEVNIFEIKKSDVIKTLSSCYQDDTKTLSSCYQADINLYIEREREMEREMDKRERGRHAKREGYPQAAICLPLLWKLSKEDEEFCRTNRPELDLQQTFQAFCNYWHTQPVSKSKRHNWSLQWQRWVSTERINDKNFAAGKTVSHNPDVAATKARADAEDALDRHGPSIQTLQAIAKIKGKVS